MIRQLKKIVLKAIIIFSVFCFDIAEAQTTYPVYYHVITLQKDSISLTGNAFYVKSVIDCRPDTTNIGTIKDGLFDSKYPAKLDTFTSQALQRYFDALLPYQKDKSPVILRITNFEISEKADANSDNGRTSISIEFYTENHNVYTKVYETKQTTSYSYSDVTKLHEVYIRETLKKCIRAFSENKTSTVDSAPITYQQLVTPLPMLPVSGKEVFYEKTTFSKLNLTVNGGFGYFFGKIPQEMPKELKNYLKGIKYAYNYCADFSFFFTKNIGIGFNYADYSSKNSIDFFRLKDEDNKVISEGSIKNNISIKRYGPGIYYRYLIKNSNTFLKASLSYERVHYLDDAILFSKLNKVEAYTNSLVGKVGIDYYIFKNIALNCCLSAVYGNIKEMEINGVPVELEKKSSILRSDLNIGLTLCY
jgi:hypothetical protein